MYVDINYWNARTPSRTRIIGQYTVDENHDSLWYSRIMQIALLMLLLVRDRNKKEAAGVISS